MADVDFRYSRITNIRPVQIDSNHCCFDRQCVDIVPYRRAVGSPTDIDYHESSCDNKGHYKCIKRFVQFYDDQTWDRVRCQFVDEYRIPDDLEYPDHYSTSLDTFLCALDRLHLENGRVRTGVITDEDWGIINLPD